GCLPKEKDACPCRPPAPVHACSVGSARAILGCITGVPVGVGPVKATAASPMRCTIVRGDRRGTGDERPGRDWPGRTRPAAPMVAHVVLLANDRRTLHASRGEARISGSSRIGAPELRMLFLSAGRECALVGGLEGRAPIGAR